MKPRTFLNFTVIFVTAALPLPAKKSEGKDGAWSGMLLDTRP